MSLRTILPLATAIVGICWQFGMTILSWVGRMLDAVALGDFVTELQLFLVNNPNFSQQFGPWILMAGGIGSLAATHLILPAIKRFGIKEFDIIYDPHDPNGKFGVIEFFTRDGTDANYTVYIIRVGVRNNTTKTLEDVSGTIEGSFADLFHPSRIQFSGSRKVSGSVNPGSVELMELFALKGPPADWDIPEGVHKIIVRVRAKDTQEQCLKFIFDKSKFPPLSLEDT